MCQSASSLASGCSSDITRGTAFSFCRYLSEVFGIDSEASIFWFLLTPFLLFFLS
jgi:hypothetical protein